MTIRCAVVRCLLMWFAMVAISAPANSQNKYGVKAIGLPAYKSLVANDSTKELVDVSKHIPGLLLDIRYATSNNFMQRAMYTSANAFLALPAANALKKVQEQLVELGYSLKVYDAYRPYSVTVDFYERIKDTAYVASAYRGSRHNRGCAVDLTIVNLRTKQALLMPTPYDDFSSKAHSKSRNVPVQAIKNRQLLQRVMMRNGFEIYADEWWHFDYSGWRNHPLLNVSFEQLTR